jgi:hypothetical protein
VLGLWIPCAAAETVTDRLWEAFPLHWGGHPLHRHLNRGRIDVRDYRGICARIQGAAHLVEELLSELHVMRVPRAQYVLRQLRVDPARCMESPVPYCSLLVMPLITGPVVSRVVRVG